jgi:hypothetical protein
MSAKVFLLKILVLAILVVLTLFMWEGYKGFSLADEGFLWYGAQRVLRGEIPIRDFMAYDPGRYYWSAALMILVGNNGIIALRVAAAIFEIIGLFIGLLLIHGRAKKPNIIYLIVAAITLEAWMFLYYKVYDITLSIILIGALTFLIQKPSRRRYFVSGLCVGLAAVFGRNHGMYGVTGSIGVMVWLRIQGRNGVGFIEGCTLWAAGVAIGFTPIFCMALLIPGFAVAFWESVRFLFEIKATNLPLPVPWPWAVNFVSATPGESIRQVLVGLFFISTLIFAVLSLIWVVVQRLARRNISPAWVAASFLALPYAHYAYSRADVEHLSLGIFPLLIGCLTLLTSQPGKIKWPLVLLLCGASLWVGFVHHRGWIYLTNKFVKVNISRNSLLIDSATAADVELLRSLSKQYASDGQSFIATPFWPGAYALLGRKSPMWEIYALFPRSQAFQQAEIERIKLAKPKFALIFDVPLDGREALRFRNTHPLIDHYIIDNFERLPNSPNPAYQLYRAKDDPK